jgi:transposase-like protein
LSDERILSKVCPHCGSTDTRRLGSCSVCCRPVCEHCGSVQFIGGERKPIHRECLKKADGQFKMIKFVQ